MRQVMEMDYRPRLTVPRWLRITAVVLWVWVVMIAASLLLSGCTSNIRMTDISIESGQDTTIDASGASNTTETGQLATADMQALIDAVKGALSAKKASILDTIKDVITGGDETTTEPAAVSPAGTVEEVD